MELDKTPVIIQVPDFGKRFYTYQLSDARTDSFGEIGTQYRTKPGLHLLGTKSKSLKYNDDGSLTLYFQNDSPGEDKESNWVPAPKDVFSLYIRAYWPKAAILDGSWTPPPVVRVN